MIENDLECQIHKEMKHFFIGTKKFGDYFLKKEFLESGFPFHKIFYQKVNFSTIQTHSVLIIHGYGEYCGRYNKVANHLAKNKADVHSFDLSGFGYSSGKRFMASYNDFQFDFHLVLKQIRNDIPLFIICHSMGGGFTLGQIIKNQKLKIAGVIFYCPWVNFPKELKVNSGTKHLLQFMPDIVSVN